MKRPKPENTHWVKLLSDVRSGWPWPYTESEIAEIAGLLPARHRERAANDIVAVARRYMSPPAAEARSGPKPDPRREIVNVKRALASFLDAIKACNGDALQHLGDQAESREQAPIEMLLHLNAFAENRGLHNLPLPQGRRGRKSSSVGWLELRFEDIFIAAHSDVRPKRGWPAFRDACLVIDDAQPADPKSRQDQLRSAKRRRNSLRTS